MANVAIVETSLTKILTRALAIADDEICNKIPKIIETRADDIISNVIKNLSNKSASLKDEMVRNFRRDIQKSLVPDQQIIGIDYKQKIFDLLNTEFKKNAVTGGGNKYNKTLRKKQSVQKNTTLPLKLRKKNNRVWFSKKNIVQLHR
jgi:hypothetical protein